MDSNQRNICTMRYFKKDGAPPIYQQWLNENQTVIESWVQNPNKTGDHLWSELGKTFGVVRETDIDPKQFKKTLEYALFKEQNGLCCYCGNKLTETWSDVQKVEMEADEPLNENKITPFIPYSIEHFESENHFKEKTFDYENLMLCCKESSRVKAYIVGKSYKKQQIENFEDVAKLVGVPLEKVVNFDKNKSISNKILKVGDVIYYPNPPHCDDSKSYFDAQKVQTTIINPSKNEDLVEKLQFLDTGIIENPYKYPILDHTFKVLELNCDTLVERRMERWVNAHVYCHDAKIGFLSAWMKEFAQIGADNEIIKTLVVNRLQKMIQEKAKPDKDGLLNQFYFVEIAFLKSYLQKLSNGKRL